MKALSLGYLMNLDIHSRDEEGRPLSEGKTPPHLLKDVPMEMAECPYTGSRYKHFLPMNVSALKQMTAHWQEILTGLRAMGSLFCGSGEQVSLKDFHTCVVACSMLPSYLFYRTHNPYPNGKLPASVSAIYKVAIGMIGSLEVMLTRGMITGEFNAHTAVTPELVIGFADREGMFIGAHEVCAGPPAMMREVVLAMCERQHSAPDWEILQEPETFQRYVAEAEKVSYLDFLMPLAFYLAVDEKGLISTMFQTLRERSPMEPAEISMEVQILDIISPILDASSRSDLRQLKQQFKKAFESVGLASEASEMLNLYKTEALRYNQTAEQIARFLAFQGHIEAVDNGISSVCRVLAAYLMMEQLRYGYCDLIATEMNRLLGRDGTPPPLTSEEVSGMFGARLRDVVAELLDLEIEATVQGACLRAGGAEIFI